MSPKTKRPFWAQTTPAPGMWKANSLPVSTATPVGEVDVDWSGAFGGERVPGAGDGVGEGAVDAFADWRAGVVVVGGDGDGAGGAECDVEAAGAVGAGEGLAVVGGRPLGRGRSCGCGVRQ